MFKVYNSYYDHTRKFETWWSLIGYLVNGHYENSIAHNDNDIYIAHYPNYYYEKVEPWQIESEIYMRHIFVQDEFDRIINLSEIREAIREYVDQPNHYKRTHGIFRYRFDPVPGIRKRRWGRYRSTHSYRKCYLDALSVETNLPEARLRKNLDMGCAWDDEFPRFTSRSWKETKKRKQWEK